ncbi:VOC family protein [candidate division KSB1 bacterium]|nr:VOC family protein [candidate division KSB1 bacterium]NIR70084.1 VOC family protein [candidate division KSB1 bacterium]NIS24434.1 VOC family protein [candidate division KSB1 bacterium]NIT71370.1 VOC family protein [candidate division KSB1 bacterium]NIU25049.1 VOC family protein [candidate division KSB1 bacterium]
MPGSQTEFSLTKIGQVSVTVHDLERAVRFYRDKLGITFLFSASKMAFFDCEGVRLMLAVPEDSRFDHPASIIYYNVDDIHDAYTILTRRGVKFETGPRLIYQTDDQELWMAFFRDSEENLLALMSETPSA